ncbi:hypothetical protein [Oceanobacillus damuensis]|uniref:hypothetical protein n=1 Tax=Oceanobacillus damuensis TaxID=937928 RepID=UPI000B2D2481|nr:hypothetical protein [Oceanobacillus damuensis]
MEDCRGETKGLRRGYGHVVIVNNGFLNVNNGIFGFRYGFFKETTAFSRKQRHFQ